MDIYLLAILPLVLFVVADLYWGMKVGIVVASTLAVILLFYFWLKTGEIDEFIALETLLIIALGGVSIRMENSQYFKFQPAVLDIIFAVVALWYQIFDDPILVKFIPQMKILAPQLNDQLSSPHITEYFNTMSLLLIIVLIIHAALVSWVAMKKGNIAWILSRLAIYPMVMLLPIIGGPFVDY